VLAKQHHGTQSMPSASPLQEPLTIPYPPSVSQGLIQGSRTLEKKRTPVEVDVLASDAVETVESRTHGYPHAEGAVFVYSSYEAQRELFKAAMLAITRTRQHEFAICGVTNSSRGKLRALCFEDQQERSLSPNTARRRVMNSSKVADIKGVETFVWASTTILMDLNLLEYGMLGNVQIRVLGAKFTSFLFVIHKNEINTTSDSSVFTLILNQARSCLRQIESHFVELMRDLYDETPSAISEFEQSLMGQSKEREASGALLLHHEKARQPALLDIKLRHMSLYRTFVRYLGSYGYKPSKVYMKYCIHTKIVKGWSEVRQPLYLSTLERLSNERTTHHERVRALRDALRKKTTAIQQRGGRLFDYKQNLKIRKHFVIENLLQYHAVQSRLKLRGARKKSWRRRWELNVRKIYSTKDEPENKQWTMANIALHIPDLKEHNRCYRKVLVTPLFSLAKQRRRREKRTLPGQFPPIVKITRSSPTLTLSDTNTSLVRVLGTLGFEKNFSDVKANDVSRRDKGVHNQLRRCSTHSSLTRFTASSRLQAPHTSIHYIKSLIMRRNNSQYKSANPGNGPTNGSDNLTEGATNNYTYDNDTPSRENQSSIPNNDMRDDADQSRDEEQENESSESDADSESEIESESDEEQEIHVSLSYQIPKDMLREAMQASPNSQASFYSHRLYRGPEDQMLSVHYCRNIEVAERAAKLFVDEKVLGFDIEWKPWASPHSIKDNASLIQLASEDRIALFHISLFSGDTPDELLPPTLKTILESPDITKVGVAIKSDFTRLKNHLGVEARGVFEISRLHNIVEHHTSPDKITKRLVSLAKQTQQHLQLPLSKGDVRESDWSKQLDPDQLRYAATDAYAGLRIFDALEAKRKKLRPTPPVPALCDSDERMPKRAKPPPKSATAEEPEKVLNTVEAIEQEEDTEGYETAPEEAIDSHELEAASDSDSASTSQTSNQGDNSDADYVPRFQRFSQATVDLGQQDNTTFNSPPKTQHIGRIDFSRLKGVDPGYPKLPRLLSEKENGSDSSDTFNPTPQTRPPRHAIKDATLYAASGHVDNNNETGESVKKEVEKLMSAMEIDDVLKVEKSQSVIANNQQNEAKQHSTQSISSAMLERNEMRERVVASPSETGPTRKEKKKKKKKPRAAESTATQASMSAGETTLAPTHFKPLVPDTASKSPEYILAEIWAQAYLRSTIPSPSTSSAFTFPPSRIRATVPHIRAYHLWHHQRLSLEEVAGHLRDPPVAISTVLGYIAQAVDLERLEYRNEDMRNVLAGLPLGLRMGRYRRLIDRVNGRGAGGSVRND
jgi:hypothetical protein